MQPVDPALVPPPGTPPVDARVQDIPANVDPVIQQQAQAPGGVSASQAPAEDVPPVDPANQNVDPAVVESLTPDTDPEHRAATGAGGPEVSQAGTQVGPTGAVGSALGAAAPHPITGVPASAAPQGQMPPSSQPGHPLQAGVQVQSDVQQAGSTSELHLSGIKYLEAEAKSAILDPAISGLKEAAAAIRTRLDGFLDANASDQQVKALTASGVAGVETIAEQLGGAARPIIHEVMGLPPVQGAVNALESIVSTRAIQAIHLFRKRLDALDL